MDVIEELNFLGKFKKNNLGSGGGRVRGGQGGCERRIKVFMKIQKKKYFFFGGGVGGGSCKGGVGLVGVGLVGGQGGCEPRIKVFVKIKKKNIFFFFLGGGGVGGSGGGSGWWAGWARVDVNAMLGVGVMWCMGDVNQE